MSEAPEKSSRLAVFQLSIAVIFSFAVLTIGSQGPTVRQLQRNLNSRFQQLEAIDNISVLVDGVFGLETWGAVKYSQCLCGLPVDGRVNTYTLNFINEGTAGLPVLSIGDTGTRVLAVQQTLIMAQIQIEPDGQFGQLTENAVTTYQRRCGITPNGVVDSLTWERVVRSRLNELPCLALLPNPYPS